MTASHFTHLEVHSNYSLLGSTADFDSLIARAKTDGFTHLPLTDSNNLYGAVRFARLCKTAEIHPIIGLALSIAPPAEDMSLEGHAPGQVVLLATNPAGYRSLCALSSLVQSQPDTTLRQRGLPWENLKQYHEGLICIEGGRQGWLERYLRMDNHPAATRYASRLGGIFQENCYLGLTLFESVTQLPNSPITSELAIAQQITRLGQRFGLPTVALQPVYTLRPDDMPLLRLLAAIDHNCLLADVPADALPLNGEFPLHWLSLDEMVERFAQFPEAITAVSDLLQKCHESVLPNGRPIWPVLNLPDEQTPDEALQELVVSGQWAVDSTQYSVLSEPWAAGSEQSAEITFHASRFTSLAPPSSLLAPAARLDHELAAIAAKGAAPFFLVVADIVRYARQMEIPISTRGSVANSLVAYRAGITTVDPLEHDLIFERFLNPSRANLPDIDLDLCSRRRDEVLAYVRQQYGAERMALVGMMSTLQPKSAVREVGKALGLPEAEIKQISALIPRWWEREEAAETAESAPAETHEPPLSDFGRFAATILDQLNEQQQQVLKTAVSLIGFPHHLSIHPGGVIITPGLLTEVVPVQMAAKGFLTTQYDFPDLEAIGLPKIDLLGIRALTVLADAAELIRTYHNPQFRLADIPLEDAKTAELLSHGDTIGVFQCESEGARRTLRQLAAKTVKDLAIANAFFKPGPAMGGMARAFVRRYRGLERVSYLHPALEPILHSTQGVLLFQEQILRVAVEVANLTWGQADFLRKGMSKMDARQMVGLKEQFVAGCQQPPHQLTAQQAEKLWEQVMAFAGYGFNQGHATAYADVSYRSAYLKAHYPAEFLAARLADSGGFHHPAIYMAEARRLGIAVHPPHVNVSQYGFTLTTGKVLDIRYWIGDSHYPVSNTQYPNLWMGLGQIRDLRHEAVRELVAKRPFSSLRDLLTRVSLQTKEITHLIQCGALDGLGSSRAAMLEEAGVVSRAGSVLQMALFAETAVSSESPADRLAWETHILGWPVSTHPLQTLPSPPPPFTPSPARSSLLGFRLPGWTGGQGFYFSNGEQFMVVRVDKNAPAPKKIPAWELLRINGRLQRDEWGNEWFQADGVEKG